MIFKRLRLNYLLYLELMSFHKIPVVPDHNTDVLQWLYDYGGHGAQEKIRDKR